MDADTRKKTWWRRKPTWVVLALSLALAYPVSFGPLTYAFRRGWVSRQAWSAYYTPLGAAIRTIYYVPGVGEPSYDLYEGWVRWWVDLADRHDAAGATKG